MLLIRDAEIIGQ